MNTSVVKQELEEINDNTTIKGQTNSSDSLSVVLSNDYESTCKIDNVTSDLTFYRNSLIITATASGDGALVGHNLAIDLSTSVNSQIPATAIWQGGTTIYISKIELFMAINAGTISSEHWGNSANDLSTGIGIYYKKSSGGSRIDLVSNQSSNDNLDNRPIVGNGGFREYFTDWNEQIRSGSLNLSVIRASKSYYPPIVIDNTGEYTWELSNENYASENVSQLRVHVEYFS